MSIVHYYGPTITNVKDVSVIAMVTVFEDSSGTGLQMPYYNPSSIAVYYKHSKQMLCPF